MEPQNSQKPDTGGDDFKKVEHKTLEITVCDFKFIKTIYFLRFQIGITSLGGYDGNTREKRSFVTK